MIPERLQFPEGRRTRSLSRIIKADQVRENPHLVSNVILDTVLVSLPDPDRQRLTVTDRESTYLYEQGYSSIEEFESSISQRQAKVKEDMLLAEAMLSEAKEKSQKIYEEAYAKGFRHGQSDAEVKVLEKTETLLDYLRDLGQAIALSQEKIVMSAEKSIGKLALAVAGKLVRREIHIDESVVEDIVRESLEAVKSGNSIKLKVNARDIDRIRDCKDTLLRAADDIPDFEIVEDPRVEQGGCIVETDFGIVDARIDSQLQEIGRAFFGDTHT